jgi:hypothetical protein
MTEETTNGITTPEPAPKRRNPCPNVDPSGHPCLKRKGHVARCRFVDTPPARGNRVAKKLKETRATEAEAATTAKRLKILIVGGDTEAREAAADFVRWALAALCRNVDSTYLGHPAGPAAGAPALEGYRISIRDAGE